MSSRGGSRKQSPNSRCPTPALPSKMTPVCPKLFPPGRAVLCCHAEAAAQLALQTWIAAGGCLGPAGGINTMGENFSSRLGRGFEKGGLWAERTNTESGKFPRVHI